MTISDLRMTAYTDRREDGNSLSTTITRDEETNFNNDNNNEHDNDNDNNDNQNINITPQQALMVLQRLIP